MSYFCLNLSDDKPTYLIYLTGIIVPRFRLKYFEYEKGSVPRSNF